MADTGETTGMGAAAVPGQTTLTPGVWTLAADQSRIGFRVKHFWELMTVQGHFTQAEGTAEVDPAGTIAVSLRIDAASVSTRQKQRDTHLRSADFFAVDQHPTLTFASTRVTAHGADRLVVEGELSVAGRTQPLTFEARLSGTSDHATTVETDVSVDRTMFGMTWSPLGMASSTATLVIHAQFRRA